MNTTVKTYGEAEAGCWFDGARGIYIGAAVIEEAIAHGFFTACEMPEGGWSDCEFYCELWEQAEEWMNGRAADGYWFGGNESGDWGLWPVDCTL